MSAIIPWNDPGGAPCCCVSCNGLPSAPSSWREIQITANEFAQIYAGGSVLTEQTMSASASGGIDASRNLQISGTLSTSYNHPLANATGLLGIVRQQGCDKRGEQASRLSFAPSSTLTYTLAPEFLPVIETVNSWSSPEFFPGNIIRINEAISLAPYNAPFIGSPFEYGLYVSRRTQSTLVGLVVFVDELNRMSASASPTAAMSSSADNATFELVLPTRTVEIPIRVTGGTFSQHRVTYSPSAP